MRAALLGLAALAALAGCDDKAPARRQQGLAPGEEVPRGATTLPAPEQPPAPEAPPSSLPSPFANSPDPGALARPEPAPPAEPPAAAQPSAPPAPPRDLSTELALLLGQPLTCLDTEAVVTGGGRVTITVTAQVVPSGRITRATVTAPGQPATALRCFEQRATNGSLKGPIPGAPTQVTATLPVEIVATR